MRSALSGGGSLLAKSKQEELLGRDGQRALEFVGRAPPQTGSLARERISRMLCRGAPGYCG